MKKKTKILGTASAIALSLGMLSFGVWSATNVNLGITSSVSFQAQGVYLKAEGSILTGSSSTSLIAYSGNEGGQYTYKGYSYIPKSDTDDTPDGTTSSNLSPWTVGEVSFTETNTYLMYKIEFTNYSEFPIKITVTDSTSTNTNIIKTLGTSEDDISYISPSETKVYELLLELNNFSESINDFNVNLSFTAVQTQVDPYLSAPEFICYNPVSDEESSPSEEFWVPFTVLVFDNLPVGDFIELSYTSELFTGTRTKLYEITKPRIEIASLFATTVIGYSGADYTLPEDAARGSSSEYGWIKINFKLRLTDGSGKYSPWSEIYSINHECLLGDTLVTMSDGKKKRLRNVKVGDKVLSVDPLTGKLIECEIYASDIKEIKKFNYYDKWILSDGTILKTVHRHRFYNVEKKSYVYMDEWKIGDHFVKEDGSIVELLEHKRVNRTVRHFAITPKLHNYFANGMLNGDRYAIDVDYKTIKFNKK